ncbi:MAG: MarR family transcriptional regulator [Candidatus Thorarchaeota archaeon]|nr:MarR family transcriptional regulator [Candidatus Thorarchaeota archaeon]
MKSNKFAPIYLVILLALPLTVLPLATPVDSLQISQDVILTDLEVKAHLGQNCTTLVLINANVTNVGATDLSHVDIRIDVRSISLTESKVDGVPVAAEIVEGDRYLIIRSHLQTALTPSESVDLSITFATDRMQERMSQDTIGGFCINHFIFYLRPLNEVRNLTFHALLPAHASLELGVSAPLFPDPVGNYTDGSRLVFFWEASVLYPGQEIAFIVKYQLPLGLIQDESAATDVTMPNLFALGLLSAFLGGVAALAIERTPNAVRKMRAGSETRLSVVSRQEEQVLSLLKRKGGSCPQREIYEELDLSQSAASMILNALEERGLIKRFREGRENLVHILE